MTLAVLALIALGAAFILRVDRLHARVRDPRRASWRTLRNCKIICIAAVAFLAWSAAAAARPSPYPSVTPFIGDRYGSAQLGPEVARSVKAKQGAKSRRTAPARRHAPPRQHWRQVPIFAPLAEPGTVEPLSVAQGARREAARVIGGRPAGCPSRFCGCGASLHLFGRIIPALNLAANWLRFPRAAPAPGMAAARRGHVFVLKQHIAGNTWLVFDANSGRGRTRIHPRSIAGYVIVNPRGNV